MNPAFDLLAPTELQSPVFAVGHQPELKWMANNDAASFDVILMNGNDIRLAKQISSPAYTPEEELSPGIWRWAVRTVDSRNRPGEWGYGNPIDTEGRANVDVPATFEKEATIELHWADPATAIRFHLQIDDLTTGTRRVIRVDDLTENSFTADEDLSSGTYRVWVRAIMPDGGSAPWSRVNESLLVDCDLNCVPRKHVDDKGKSGTQRLVWHAENDDEHFR